MGVKRHFLVYPNYQALLDQKIITKEPKGAWTHEITDKALK